MKVITNITLCVRGEDGKEKYLAPGKHDLPELVANAAIVNGHAVKLNKDGSTSDAPGTPSGAPPADPNGGQGGDKKDRPLLQNPIPVIVEGLGKLNADELDALAKEESEKGDKARKGVLDAIEAAKAELQK